MKYILHTESEYYGITIIKKIELVKVTFVYYDFFINYYLLIYIYSIIHIFPNELSSSFTESMPTPPVNSCSVNSKSNESNRSCFIVLLSLAQNLHNIIIHKQY